MDELWNGGRNRSYSFQYFQQQLPLRHLLVVGKDDGSRKSFNLFKSGSADVLEALGINLDLGPEDLGRVFEKAGIVFLFAKNLHPGMRYIIPARWR